MRQLCDSRQKREPGGWIGRSTEWWRYDDDCIIMIICWYHDEYIMNIWWLNVYCWYNDGQTSGTRKRLKGLGHNTNNQVIWIIDNYGQMQRDEDNQKIQITANQVQWAGKVEISKMTDFFHWNYPNPKDKSVPGSRLRRGRWCPPTKATKVPHYWILVWNDHSFVFILIHP